MRVVTRYVDVRRLLVAGPLLVGAGVLVWFLIGRNDASGTPRATLADTPAGVTDDIGVQKGELARNFVASAPDGALVRLSDLRGRPTIINFWATWCSSCLVEMPEFKDAQQRVGAENLNVLAINAGEDANTAQNFLDELQADAFRIGMDPTLVVADAYGVFGLPTSIFLDAGGIVRGIYAGHLSRDDLDAFVTASLAGRDVDEPAPKLRLVTTVARDNILEVRERDGVVDFRAKSLRCDEMHCASEALDGLAGRPGVSSIDRRLTEDPPRVVVRYDSATTDAGAIVEAMVELLDALEDPLYENPLQVERR
jgi:thiol-disulfide isomerase/thioredoxin